MLRLVAQLCRTLCDPMDCSPQGSSVHGDSPSKKNEVDCHALLQGTFPSPGIELRSPTLQADSLPSELPGKPKNIGLGSLSLLQGNFPTQESNLGFLHCRQIFYHLSYLGSPERVRNLFKAPQLGSWWRHVGCKSCLVSKPLLFVDTKVPFITVCAC